MTKIAQTPLKNYPWYMRVLFALQKKKYGRPLEPSLLWGRKPALLFAFLKFLKFFERKKSPLSKSLRAQVMLRVSEINNCAFCVDMNAYSAMQHQREDNDREKCALAYAQAITDTNKSVTDEVFQNLKKHFSDDDIIELAALISFQNLSCKFNSALGVAPYGFCKKKEGPIE